MTELLLLAAAVSECGLTVTLCTGSQEASHMAMTIQHACRWQPSSIFTLPFFAIPAVLGRCLAGAVEIWVIVRHIRGMLTEDAQARQAHAHKAH